MNDVSVEELKNELDSRLKTIRSAMSDGALESNHGYRNKIEQLYSVSYQKLVRAKVFPQIRKKYR